MLAWFPCYVNDLLGSMRWKCMTPAERGAYWQLICWQMQADDGHLPESIEELSVLADLNLLDHPRVVDAFPVDDSGRRANPRAVREWHKRGALSQVRGDAGRKGNAKRWQKDRNCDANGIANGSQMLQQPQPQPQQHPDATTTTRERRTGKPALLYRWDDLAAIYPESKMTPDKRAKAWWRRHVKDGDDMLVDDILAGARAWADSPQYRDGFGFGILRFLDEGIWKKVPSAAARPMTKDDLIRANNRRTTEEIAARHGVSIDNLWGTP